MTQYKVCPMCKSKVSKFVKSHIIPKSLWVHNFPSKKSVSLFDSDESEEHFLKDVIANKFICDTCEGMFSDCDDYALKFFVHDEGFVDVVGHHPNGRLKLYENLNRFLLRKFFATVLLRVQLSNNKYLPNIKLGDCYLQKIIQDVFSKKQNAFEYIDAYITKRTSIYHSANILPRKCRETNGINGYMLGLPYFEIFVKVDKRKLPIVNSDISSKSLIQISKKFGESSYSLSDEYKTMNFVMAELDLVSDSIKEVTKNLQEAFGANKGH